MRWMYPMMQAEIASSSQNTESVQELNPKGSRRDLYLTPIHDGTKKLYTWSL